MKEEIFTVGEEVITNSGRGRHKILGFKIIDGKMCVELEGFKTQYEFLSRISKPKEEVKEPEMSDVELCNILGRMQNKVVHIRENDFTHFGGMNGYTFEINGKIPKEKYYAIKQAIEQIINNEVSHHEKSLSIEDLMNLSNETGYEYVKYLKPKLIEIIQKNKTNEQRDK